MKHGCFFRNRTYVLTACVSLCCVSLCAMHLAVAPSPRPAHGHAFQKPMLQIDIGAKEAAQKYYKEVVSPQVGFATPDTILLSTVQDLLNFLGYTSVTPKDLHRLSSKELMALGGPNEILATAFFAPKITDVSENNNIPPLKGYGWRKLIRFKAKPSSDADHNEIDSLYFLQNIFEPDLNVDPLDPDKHVSLNNQAILVRRLSAAPLPTKQAAYFLTYEPLVVVDSHNLPVKGSDGKFVDNGRISFGLAATFDEDDRDPETNSDFKEYFVPAACVQCHGGNSARGKLNFLDTDAWLDRVSPQYGVAAGSSPFYSEEDFTAVAGSPFAVLYDCGKDPMKPEFNAGFDIFRKLNESIRDQNQAVGQGSAVVYQLEAVKKWLDLHAASTDHIPPYKRGFGTQIWGESNQTHRKALYFFSRYCYRCHSSVRYNVFDLANVKARIPDMRERVVEVTDPLVWMPQDRIIPGLKPDGTATADLKEFLDLLDQISAGH